MPGPDARRERGARFRAAHNANLDVEVIPSNQDLGMPR